MYVIELPSCAGYLKQLANKHSCQYMDQRVGRMFIKETIFHLTERNSQSVCSFICPF